MSRQNKVNPGMYTQRGRLAQDDAAREIAKQRSVGSEHTWQPVRRDHEPRLTPETEGDDEDTAIVANEKPDTKRPRVAAKPAAAKKTTARKTVKASARGTTRVKKTAAPASRGKARTGRTAKARAK